MSRIVVYGYFFGQISERTAQRDFVELTFRSIRVLSALHRRVQIPRVVSSQSSTRILLLVAFPFISHPLLLRAYRFAYDSRSECTQFPSRDIQKSIPR